jgi:hypothetical protein
MVNSKNLNLLRKVKKKQEEMGLTQSDTGEEIIKYLKQKGLVFVAVKNHKVEEKGRKIEENRKIEEINK